MDKIKSKPERAEKHVAFGIWSIIISVLLTIVAYFLIRFCLYLFNLGISTNLAIIGNIIVIMLAVAVPIMYLTLLINPLIFSIAQMRINKKPIGWISLIIAILAIYASAILIIISN